MDVTVHPPAGRQRPVRSCLMNTRTLAHPVAENVGDFDLDVSIVEAGDVVNALLCSRMTANGCDTQCQRTREDLGGWT